MPPTHGFERLNLLEPHKTRQGALSIYRIFRKDSAESSCAAPAHRTHAVAWACHALVSTR